MEWGKIIAIATIFFFIFSKESKKIPVNLIVFLVITLFLWSSVTTFFAKYPDSAWPIYVQWSKIAVMMLISSMLINSKVRLHAFVWIVCISIGYFGVKGGLFTAISGGNYYVYGPPGSSIHDTNEISRAFMMCIPLMYFIAVQSNIKIVRTVMLICTLLTVLGLFGTTSRTAFLVLLVMLLFGWMRSTGKFKIAFWGVAVVGIVFAVLPSDRIDGLAEKYATSSQYETDSSFQGRVKIWSYIVDDLAANNPIMGGGFAAVVKETTTEPHSNYFQMLGEHGYVGLAIYLMLGLAALLGTNRIFNRTKSDPSLTWARDLALMLQISFIGYFLAGVTKNHAFFELYYMQLAMVVALERIVATELSRKKGDVPVAVENVR